MADWWITLTMAQKVFWCIAIPFSLLFLVQTILTFTGLSAEDADATGDSDASVDGDTGIDFQFLTLKNLIAFLRFSAGPGSFAWGRG